MLEGLGILRCGDGFVGSTVREKVANKGDIAQGMVLRVEL
jgi:hypothetical protein